MRSLVVFLSVALALAVAAPTVDGSAHPYVGLAYRRLPTGHFVACSGSLVRFPGSGHAHVFLTSGECVAHHDGNGAAFRVTLDSNPHIERDATTGAVLGVKSATRVYRGIGYTEFRMDHYAQDAQHNVGFITLNPDQGVDVSPDALPSLPAQADSLDSVSTATAVLVSYAVARDGVHGYADHVYATEEADHARASAPRSELLPGRHFCGVEHVQGDDALFYAKLSAGCAVGDSGAPLLVADKTLYGLVFTGLAAADPQPARQGVRTDTPSFQALVERVAPLVNPASSALPPHPEPQEGEEPETGDLERRTRPY